MGPKASERIALSTPGALIATQALELVEIDHILADVIIVDSHHRRSSGRPWLSLAIDVATRRVVVLPFFPSRVFDRSAPRPSEALEPGTEFV
jgi:hypothetical protein